MQAAVQGLLLSKVGPAHEDVDRSCCECTYCCRFIPLLGELLDCPHTGLRCAATDVLIEIVSKRMEPTAKISLVQQLKVVEACERLSTNLVMAAGASKAAAAAGSRGQGNGTTGSDGPAAAAAQQLVQDEELLAKYAKLLATLAGEVMDALKRIENGKCRKHMLLQGAWESARAGGPARHHASKLFVLPGAVSLQVRLTNLCMLSPRLLLLLLLLRSGDQFQHSGSWCER
jgi:hypothetical protein